MNKTAISLLLVIVLAFGWVYAAMLFVNNGEEIPQKTIDQIEYLRKVGEEQRKYQAYGKAVECYENIVALNPTVENYHQLCDVLEEANRSTKLKEILITMVSIFPSDKKSYERLAQFYFDSTSYKECSETCANALNTGVKTEKIEDLYYKSTYAFELSVSDIPKAGRFYNGYSVVKRDEGFYYVSTNLKYELGPYKYATSFTDELAAVLDDSDTYYFIDLDGEKYLSTTQSYDIAYSFSENYAIVKTNEGKYKYLSKDNILGDAEFEYATLYKNGVAGVKYEGRWYLINSAGAKIGDKSYADILYDEDNICSNCGVIFVSDKKGSGYYMVDLQGNRIGSETFESAKPFFDYNLAAVKKNGKWGYVNTEGKIVIKCQYEDAQSFGYNCGAVKIDGKWGFIADNNRIVIEPDYDDAKCFSSSKLCPVVVDGKWSYLKLLS